MFAPRPEPEKPAEPEPEPEPDQKREPEVKPEPEMEPPVPKEKAKTEPKPKAAAKPKEPVEEPLPGQLSFGGLPVVLNGAPLRLEPKPQGGDYYLMDLLERSGLDFSKLDRPVDLLVNGAEGQFSQVLRPNDQVTIRYRDE